MQVTTPKLSPPRPSLRTSQRYSIPTTTPPRAKSCASSSSNFFVACSLQDIVRLYLRNHQSFDAFPDKVAIQLNDTHPAIGVAELMRIFMDEHGLDWTYSWDLTRRTFAYTNHTLLAEALEKWPVSLFGRLLPRHLEIIYAINQSFMDEINAKYPGDYSKMSRMSLIEEGQEKQVRMAHLACVGSHTVNGVAELHTELIKKELMQDFYQLWPDKFQNKTNGVTPRRWLLMSNPELSRLITEKVGDGWVKDLDKLRQLEPFAEDPEFRTRWRQIKLDRKQLLAEYILRSNSQEVDPNSLFDVQIKRIHEYKRQLLCAMHMIALYNRVKANPEMDLVPRTFIFGGKAAPGYFVAKMVVKLINSVGEVINNDPDIAGRLKVVFLANYSVSLGQFAYPAADLSEQVSTAGKEASGTGNMKFAMNGALTIGTLDGANVEIREEVGAENFFLFGMTAQEVSEKRAAGYKPADYYHANPVLKQVIDQMGSGFFSPKEPGLFMSLVDSLLNSDEYMLLADFQAYLDCQERVSEAFRDQDNWARMSILNVARMGKFSSDRTIAQYLQRDLER